MVYDLIGYISIVFALIAFLSTDKQTMRFNGAISVLLFAISIFSYGGINGVFVSVISFITKLLSLNFKESSLNFIKFLSLALSLIFFFLFNEEGLIGLLPAISLIFIMFADLQEEVWKMKVIYFGSAFSWLIYGILLGSVPAILYDVFGIFALSYSLYKLKIFRS